MSDSPTLRQKYLADQNQRPVHMSRHRRRTLRGDLLDLVDWARRLAEPGWVLAVIFTALLFAWAVPATERYAEAVLRACVP